MELEREDEGSILVFGEATMTTRIVSIDVIQSQLNGSNDMKDIREVQKTSFYGLGATRILVVRLQTGTNMFTSD
jgi:hypothetical protein